MLSIGNKKYRNLQEQVGFNTEQIEKIFDVLDGLAVTDNVVAIADLSDNLNADQLEIVQKSVAFLVYDGQLYIKKSEDASNAYFDIVFTISSSGGVISFNSKEIEVVLATGALSQTTTTHATYSSTQIDSLLSAKASISYVDTQLATALATKASLTGANFTGAITSPSIIETMSGYSAVLQAGTGTFTPIYIGACKNGNKLTFVVFGTWSQETSTSLRALVDFYLPLSVANKLYPVTLGASDLVLDIKNIKVWSDLDVSKEVICRVSKIGDNVARFLINTSNASLTANTNYLLRYEATFLLSDSLL